MIWAAELLVTVARAGEEGGGEGGEGAERTAHPPTPGAAPEKVYPNRQIHLLQRFT